MLWGATRDRGFSTVRITHKGEVYKLLQTVTHPSLWMIVKLSDIEESPILTTQDLPVKVNPALIHGLIGVFVDDLLKTVRIEHHQDGLHIHQQSYTKELTTAAPEHFGQTPAVPPDPANHEHNQKIHYGQQVLGGLLWLSTRTRPDLSYAVSTAASVLTKALTELDQRLSRHTLRKPKSCSPWLPPRQR
eukprot:909832-Amphidinium_carterae.2